MREVPGSHHPPRSAARLRVRAIAILGVTGVGFALLPLLARTAQTQTTTERVSVVDGGAQANGESNSSCPSSDGRYIAFTSLATNLVAGDTNGLGDVFVKDRQTGGVVRISVANDGAQAGGASRSAAISGNGRRIAFVSDASNLVSGDANGVADVFVRDLDQGSTARVSVPAIGGEADGESFGVAISNDGRFVAFASQATNLVSGDGNAEPDVFVRDLSTGALERVSVGPTGQDADGGSEAPTISADGRFVAFASVASNLLASANGTDTNQAWDVYVRDRTTGTMLRASVNTSGAEGNGHSFAPSLSADGSLVAFSSYATTLVAGDANGHVDIFLHYFADATTMRVSIGETGETNADSFHPSLSGDGYRMAFESLATNWDADGTAGKMGIFVHDFTTGGTTRLSIGLSAASANESAGRPVLSLDGRWLAFSTGASNMVASDTNNAEDVFVRGPLQ